MRSLAREESEESPEESDLKKLASVTAITESDYKQLRRFAVRRLQGTLQAVTGT